jgi:transposase
MSSKLTTGNEALDIGDSERELQEAREALGIIWGMPLDDSLRKRIVAAGGDDPNKPLHERAAIVVAIRRTAAAQILHNSPPLLHQFRLASDLDHRAFLRRPVEAATIESVVQQTWESTDRIDALRDRVIGIDRAGLRSAARRKLKTLLQREVGAEFDDNAWRYAVEAVRLASFIGSLQPIMNQIGLRPETVAVVAFEAMYPGHSDILEARHASDAIAAWSSNHGTKTTTWDTLKQLAGKVAPFTALTMKRRWTKRLPKEIIHRVTFLAMYMRMPRTLPTGVVDDARSRTLRKVGMLIAAIRTSMLQPSFECDATTARSGTGTGHSRAHFASAVEPSAMQAPAVRTPLRSPVDVAPEALMPEGSAPPFPSDHESSDPAAPTIEERRFRAVKLYSEGWKQRDIAAALGVSQSAVSQWVSQHRRLGCESLRVRKSSGPKPKLSQESLAIIPSILSTGAKFWGFSDDHWTATRVADVIDQVFGFRFHEAHVSRLLSKLGVPLSRAFQHGN